MAMSHARTHAQTESGVGFHRERTFVYNNIDLGPIAFDRLAVRADWPRAEQEVNYTEVPLGS